LTLLTNVTWRVPDLATVPSAGFLAFAARSNGDLRRFAGDGDVELWVEAGASADLTGSDRSAAAAGAAGAAAAGAAADAGVGAAGDAAPPSGDEHATTRAMAATPAAIAVDGCGDSRFIRRRAITSMPSRPSHADQRGLPGAAHGRTWHTRDAGQVSAAC
jgi:hypothetical protein